jgi:hypothetical protein
MTTTAQAAANAANAQLSTGPRTAAGKHASSRNALRHGLTAKTLVLITEDKDAFDNLRAALHAAHSPADDLEHAAVEALAEAHWRLNRCRRHETAVFNQAIADIQRDNPELDPDEAAARLFLDPVYMKKLSLFLRYQTSIERAYNKAEAELRRLQKARCAAEADTNGFVSQPRLRPSEAALLEAAINIPLPPLDPEILAEAGVKDAERAARARR